MSVATFEGYEAANLKSLSQTVELFVVTSCLNEAGTLVVCIEKARRAMQQQGIMGEIIIADNGSTDGSDRIAMRSEPKSATQPFVTADGKGSSH